MTQQDELQTGIRHRLHTRLCKPAVRTSHQMTRKGHWRQREQSTKSLTSASLLSPFGWSTALADETGSNSACLQHRWLLVGAGCSAASGDACSTVMLTSLSPDHAAMTAGSPNQGRCLVWRNQKHGSMVQHCALDQSWIC